MQNKSIKQTTTPLLTCDGNSQLLSYSSKYKNNTLIYSSHIEFNGDIIKHDRNAQAYQIAYTVNEYFVVIFVQRPHAVQLFDLRNGDFMVARGLEDVYSYKIVSASTQAEYGVRPAQHNRKIYLILQDKGKYFLKAIQIDQKIENNPKDRLKLIEQGTGMNIKKFAPVFSLCRWNLFIMISKNMMRVCKPAIKSNEISIQFASQNFENKIAQIFNNNQIIGMVENSKTWAILYANNGNGKNDSMELIVFWQCYFSPELIRNMYYRDQTYIKSVSIPCSRRQFVRIWEADGFYIVETKGSASNSHCCHIVFQEAGYNCTTLNMSYDSVICPYSLSNNPNQVSICEILNKNQLNKTSLSQSEDNNKSQETRGSSNNLNTDNKTLNTSAQQKQLQSQQKYENIKKFNPVQESHKEEIKSDQKQGKSTAKKSQKIEKSNKSPIVEQTKSLIDAKLVEHFTKIEQQNKNQQKKQQEQELQVPNSLQPLVSFGRPGDAKTNKPNTTENSTNKAIISFGAQNTTAQIPKQTKQNTIKQQVKSQKKFTKQQINKVKQQFLKYQKKLIQQLKDRSESIQENYSPKYLAELIKIQNMFDLQQLQMFKQTNKKLNLLQFNIDRNKRKLKAIENESMRKINKLNEIKQKFDVILTKIKVTNHTQLSLFIKQKRIRKPKQIHEDLQQNLKSFHKRIQQLQQSIQQYSLTTEKRIQEYYAKQNNSSTNKIMNFLLTRKNVQRRYFRIPVFQRYQYIRTQPLIQITQLPM